MSASSNVIYSQEPFETIAEKLYVLLQLLFADAYSACAVIYRIAVWLQTYLMAQL
jgi:hypothetical protein